MEQKFILTAFGKDRPGIVADVAEVVYEHGCNLEDSTMTRLADEFTLILLLQGTRDDLGEILTKECRRLERETGLSAFIRPVEPEAAVSTAGSRKKMIQVEGMDQAGIVSKVSRYLSDHKINIENLKSKRIFSPESGQAFYTMDIETQVPYHITARDLENGLDKIANELNVDILVK